MVQAPSPLPCVPCLSQSEIETLSLFFFMATTLVVLGSPEADPVSRFSVAPAPHPPHGLRAACYGSAWA